MGNLVMDLQYRVPGVFFFVYIFDPGVKSIKNLHTNSQHFMIVFVIGKKRTDIAQRPAACRAI
jgi:hypothetical protein